MNRNVVWLTASCLMALSLVLASCGPSAEEAEVLVPEEVEEEEEEERVSIARDYRPPVTTEIGPPGQILRKQHQITRCYALRESGHVWRKGNFDLQA